MNFQFSQLPSQIVNLKNLILLDICGLQGVNVVHFKATFRCSRAFVPSTVIVSASRYQELEDKGLF